MASRKTTGRKKVPGRTTSRKAKRKRTGPERKPIDAKELAQLCRLHVTLEDVACVFGVSPSTIDRRMRDDRTFRANVDKARAEGRISLRRALMSAALQCGTASGPKGAATIAIHLSKQPEDRGGLGMTDKLEAVLEVQRPDYSKLSDEELETLLALTRKAKPAK